MVTRYKLFVYDNGCPCTVSLPKGAVPEFQPGSEVRRTALATYGELLCTEADYDCVRVHLELALRSLMTDSFTGYGSFSIVTLAAEETLHGTLSIADIWKDTVEGPDTLLAILDRQL